MVLIIKIVLPMVQNFTKNFMLKRSLMTSNYDTKVIQLKLAVHDGRLIEFNMHTGSDAMGSNCWYIWRELVMCLYVLSSMTQVT